MGVRNASSGNNTIQNATIVGNSITIAALTGIIGLVQDNAQVIILWNFILLVGTAITGLNVQLRRGSTTVSTQINQNQGVTVTAAQQIQVSGSYTDLPGVSGGVQYAVTLNPSGSGNNSTLLDASIVAFVL